MIEPVHIVGYGACTAVGRTAWSSAAAVRAGISGSVLHPYMIDTNGEPMRAAIAPWLEIGLQGTERFASLIIPALDEAFSALPRRVASPARFALALATPSPRPGLPSNLAHSLLTRIHDAFSATFGSAEAFEIGHAAGLVAVKAAFRRLSQGALDACIVAGVESWLEPKTLEWLEQCDQLHGAGRFNNAWGFVPGEAGAALLLVREGAAHGLGLHPLATLLGVGEGHEPNRIKTETICIGEGLTQAFRTVLSVLPKGSTVSDIYCDMNGEPYRADEFGFTALRTKEYFASVSDFVAPADCWGDVSAAGGLLHLMLASAAARKDYSKGKYALVWASSELGERAAALVSTAAFGD